MLKIRVLAVSVVLAACGDKQGVTTGGPTLATFTDPSDPSNDPSADPSDAPTSGEQTGASEATGEPTGGSMGMPAQALDVLFVIDNSGSMAEEQQRLTAAMGSLVAALPADTRIAFTTTDAGNPRCPSTTPENGNLVLRSCIDRVQEGEFVSSDVDYSQACTAHCALSDGQLTVKPTTTDVDATATPRKWIEVKDGVSNIEGASVAEALQCYAPQGVAGCGFESHLESMYKALARSKDKGSDNNFGFVREDAALAVVIVSDETDCSYNPNHQDIFITNKVFWYDPAADVAPSSSMCWDAGVRCEGDAPTFSGCVADNKDEEGNEGVVDDAAVLHPVGKYVDFVKEFKKDRPVRVALISGVPIGYDSFDAELVYKDSPDLTPGGYQSLFGIGPGCIVGPANMPTATAVPPVREREFAEAFAAEGRRDVYSICDDDYAGALATIVSGLVE